MWDWELWNKLESVNWTIGQSGEGNDSIGCYFRPHRSGTTCSTYHQESTWSAASSTPFSPRATVAGGRKCRKRTTNPTRPQRPASPSPLPMMLSAPSPPLRNNLWHNQLRFIRPMKPSVPIGYYSYSMFVVAVIVISFMMIIMVVGYLRVYVFKFQLMFVLLVERIVMKLRDWNQINRIRSDASAVVAFLSLLLIMWRLWI